jgi:hypothetical protein
MYGLIVTSTGWTHAAIDEMSLCDVLDLVDYWGENPPTHIILAARYLDRGAKRPAKRSESDVRSDMAQLGTMLGPAAPVPAHLREMAQWASKIVKK